MKKSLIERYDAGRRREVWRAIHELGPVPELDETTATDVTAVTQRTMDRARANVATIYDRLCALDFVFEERSWAYVPTGPEMPDIAEPLRSAAGAIPASLSAWLARVGSVCFRGHLPALGSLEDWQNQYLDPLEFLFTSAEIESELDFIADTMTHWKEVRPFHLSFAGDYMHKNNVSGGAATVIYLPADEGDARVIEDDGTPNDGGRFIWFVDYLRLYFESGGFRRIAQTKSFPAKLIAHLSKDLLDM